MADKGARFEARWESPCGVPKLLAAGPIPHPERGVAVSSGVCVVGRHTSDAFDFHTQSGTADAGDEIPLRTAAQAALAEGLAGRSIFRAFEVHPGGDYVFQSCAGLRPSLASEMFRTKQGSGVGACLVCLGSQVVWVDYFRPYDGGGARDLEEHAVGCAQGTARENVGGGAAK